jgi:activator of 2-hydroxyglutaryl-CoA dehydratase
VDKHFAGIDVGTTTTKAVIIDADRNLLGHAVRRSGADLTLAATTAFEEAIAHAGIAKETIQFIVATGFGRRNVPFADDSKTEISCHARGCHHYFPEALTIVDIGGQDNKVIKLDAQGLYDESQVCCWHGVFSGGDCLQVGSAPG